MINSKKIAVVMPAYNAEKTILKTYNDIPHDIVDEIILVDDCSTDDTERVAREIGIPHVIRLQKNLGYGGNQKACYDKALSLGADIIIMLHPDYQYEPKLITAMCSMIAYGVYPVVLGSRILGNGALKGGMPIYKYIFNRILTLCQNLLTGQKLSEYHTGYRAFSREVVEGIAYSKNNNDFVFDNEMLAQIIMKDFPIGEVSCPTKYFEEASSISFSRSVTYGLGVLAVSFRFRLHKWGILKTNIY